LSGSKVSRRYAKALLSLGQQDGQYESYGKGLQAFVEYCKATPDFFAVISNKIFSVEDRKKVLDFVLKKSEFPSMVNNFLKLLLEKNRIGAIPDITDYYVKLTDALSNVTRADILTAKPLKTQALEKLKKTLSDLTSKEVRFEVKVDESLIGGLVVKIGDLVLDGSVKAQLEGLKESLKRGEYN